MVKKYLLALLLLGLPLYGDQCEPCEVSCCAEDCCGDFLVEAKVGYFYFLDDDLRDIFHSGGPKYELSLMYNVWCDLYIYSSIEYFNKHGHATGGTDCSGHHPSTRIWFLPLNLGLLWDFCITPCIDFYVKAGPQYTWVNIKNNSDDVDHHNNKSGFGGFAGLGFLFDFWDCWVIDVYGTYNYLKFNHWHTSKENVETHNPQLGGLTAGAGIGYRF